MRLVAIPVVLVLASASLAAGCGGSGHASGETNAAPLRVAADDVRLLVTIPPEATAWPWPVDPQTHVASPSSFTLDQSEPSYRIQKAVRDAYQEAGLVRLATSSWLDGVKKASSFANLVATPADARSAMEAEHEFARHWFPDEAGFVEIGWTRANAVLTVYVTCNPCDSDVADAARRWADKIDDATRTAAN